MSGRVQFATKFARATSERYCLHFSALSGGSGQSFFVHTILTKQGEPFGLQSCIEARSSRVFTALACDTRTRFSLIEICMPRKLVSGPTVGTVLAQQLNKLGPSAFFLVKKNEIIHPENYCTDFLELRIQKQAIVGG